MGHVLPGAGRPAAERIDTLDAAPTAALEPSALAAQRATVEAALTAESRDAARVADLLKTATPWLDWPERFRQVLRAAITEEGDGMEAQKARWLRGQLFRDVDPGWPPVLPSTLPSADRRLVERLRMDLLGRTPLGCGQRLNAAPPSGYATR